MTIQTLDPAIEQFRTDLLRGLRLPQKMIPCKYFYDAQGSHLFDRICDLPEYYPTRTELAIMDRYAKEMAGCLGSHCVLIELGSGSSLKTRVLLEQLHEPACYLPVDICMEHLQNSARRLSRRYPELRIVPVCADFTRDFELPDLNGSIGRRVVYFPGSTIGNFGPRDSRQLLRHIARLAGPGGGLLIGVDLKKDRDTLERAYNDPQGVTAAFNLNVLARANRELGTDFQLDRFHHRAFYNEELGRIEMHLVSLIDQSVRLGESEIVFEAGETIHTESSHKYDLQEFSELARTAGMEVQKIWTDAFQLFSIQYLTID